MFQKGALSSSSKQRHEHHAGKQYWNGFSWVNVPLYIHPNLIPVHITYLVKHQITHQQMSVQKAALGKTDFLLPPQRCVLKTVSIFKNSERDERRNSVLTVFIKNVLVTNTDRCVLTSTDMQTFNWLIKNRVWRDWKPRLELSALRVLLGDHTDWYTYKVSLHHIKM